MRWTTAPCVSSLLLQQRICKFDSTATTTPRWFSSNSAAAAEIIAVEEELPLKFQDLNLHPAHLAALEGNGISAMTDIQAQTFDVIANQGKDVVGRARTGQGKTLAFLLPALERVLSLHADEAKNKIRILVISPTRELAHQIHETAETLTSKKQNVHNTKMSCQVLYGGVSKGKDMQALDRQTPTILTATPGRLLDHLENSYLRDRDASFASLVKDVDILVLDEMDRLLDMGFSRDIHRILEFLPSKQDGRQTLLFSATVPPSVQAEIRRCVRRDNFVHVDCIQEDDPHSHTVETTQQSHIVLPPTINGVQAVVELIMLLMNREAKVASDSDTATANANAVAPKITPKIMVFFNTTSQVSFFAALLRSRGVARVLELHSKMTQEGRSKTSDRFRKAPPEHPSVLLTSDVSARGVDYPNVTQVVQIGTASDRETYIHRLGRTGRAGKQGEGILVLVDPKTENAVFSSDLKGMDIPLNKELQDALLMTMESDGNATAVANNRKMKELLQSPDMQRKGSDCYRSLLGFYFQRFKALGVYRPANLVVNLINQFAAQAKLHERPAISSKLAQQYGLAGMDGITVREGGPRDRNDGHRHHQRSSHGKSHRGEQLWRKDDHHTRHDDDRRRGGRFNNDRGRGGRKQRRGFSTFTRTFQHNDLSNAVATRRSHYTYASPGEFDATAKVLEHQWSTRDFTSRGFTVGIGGPVGSGKTALTLKLLQLWQSTPELAAQLHLGVVTNDIFTQEDAEFLTRHDALPPDRIAAVETGGCPHAAIREDVSSNLNALEQLTASAAAVQDEPILPLLLCESGGDNLAANFSRELADLTLYVIDVAGGDKVPRKGGPGITQSDLLIINKIDLAEAVGSDLGIMERDANRMRSYSNRNQGSSGEEDRVAPTIFCSVRQNIRVAEISDFILDMYEKATSTKLQLQSGQHHDHDHHQH